MEKGQQNITFFDQNDSKIHKVINIKLKVAQN